MRPQDFLKSQREKILNQDKQYEKVKPHRQKKITASIRVLVKLNCRTLKGQPIVCGIMPDIRPVLKFPACVELRISELTICKSAAWWWRNFIYVVQENSITLQPLRPHTKVDGVGEITMLCGSILTFARVRFNLPFLRKTVQLYYDLRFNKKVGNPDDFDVFVDWEGIGKNPFDKIEIITHTLAEYGVITHANEVESDELFNVQTPFLAISRNTSGTVGFNFVIVLDVSEAGVQYFDIYHGIGVKDWDSFLSSWTNAMMAIEWSQAKENNFELRRQDWMLNKFLLALSVVVAAVSIGFIGYKIVQLNSLPAGLLFATKVSGLLVCMQLFRLEHHNSYGSKLLEKFCKRGPQFSCAKVLSSKAAKPIGSVSMTDVGCVYFGASLFMLVAGLLAGSLVPTLSFLLLLTLVSLPYTLFSVIYQSFVIKRWCMLCLLVQSLLWLELLSYAINGNWVFAPSFEFILLGAIVFVTAIYFQKYLKGIKRSDTDRKHYSEIALLFLRDINILKARLYNNIKISEAYLSGDMYMGEGETEVMVILDPHCPMCSERYKKLRSLHDPGCKVTFRIIGGDYLVPVLQDILSLTLAGKNTEALAALDNWYQLKTEFAAQRGEGIDEHDLEYNTGIYNVWVKRHSFSASARAAVEYIKNVQWHNKNIMSITPAIFINGYFWPPEFDFDYFLKFQLAELEPVEDSVHSVSEVD
ncbi:MAG TPA: vitamin K epoxide reductase family protein [Chitinophagaceae bacterium]|nr:vitamin K epoxide reductase family protein [Chitinophagaceae bacterium]